MSSPCDEVLAAVRLRPVCDADRAHLFGIYASTREAERRQFDWPEEMWEQFLRQQFELQHEQYMRGYSHPSFDLILVDEDPAGRLYVDRQEKEIRVIDIALLPKYRGRGIGGRLLRELLAEAHSSGRCIGLHVERDNPILPFYLRLGLAIEADRGVYFYMRTRPASMEDASPAASPGFPELQAFADCLHNEFSICAPSGDTAVLRLESVSDISNGGSESFSLMFAGPAKWLPVHETCEVSHPALGSFPLFLGPVRCRASGEVRYQAIVGRMRVA